MKGNRAQRDIEAKGRPFSHCEVKPLNLWKRIVEHHHVTHVVDFAAGFGALAIAGAGAMECEGAAATEVHCDWLNSTLDRCVMYLAGKHKDFVKRLGGDAESMEKVGKYFGGMMMEARRMLEPLAGDAGESEPEDRDADA